MQYSQKIKRGHNQLSVDILSLQYIWVICSLNELENNLTLMYGGNSINIKSRVKFGGAYMKNNLLYVYLFALNQEYSSLDANIPCVIESTFTPAPEWVVSDNNIKVENILLLPLCKLVENYCKPYVYLYKSLK